MWLCEYEHFYFLGLAVKWWEYLSSTWVYTSTHVIQKGSSQVTANEIISHTSSTYWNEQLIEVFCGCVRILEVDLTFVVPSSIIDDVIVVVYSIFSFLYKTREEEGFHPNIFERSSMTSRMISACCWFFPDNNLIKLWNEQKNGVGRDCSKIKN